MEVTQDVLLPILFAAVIANAVLSSWSSSCAPLPGATGPRRAVPG